MVQKLVWKTKQNKTAFIWETLSLKARFALTLVFNGVSIRVVNEKLILKVLGGSVLCLRLAFTVGEVRATNSDVVSKTTGQWHPTKGLRYRAVCRCCWPMKRSSSRVPPSDSAWTLRGTCTWSASGCWGGLRWRAQSSEWFPTLKTQSTTQTTSPRCISNKQVVI